MYLHVGAQAWNMEHWRGIEEMSKKHKYLSKRCICRQMQCTCRQIHTVIPRQNSGLHLWVHLSTDEKYLSTDTHRQPRTELRFCILECTFRQMQIACRQIHSEIQIFWNPVLSLSAPVDRCKCTCRQTTETRDLEFPNPAPLGCFLPPRPPPLPNTI